MNPDRHATSHYDFFKNLIKGDDVSAQMRASQSSKEEYNASS
jgi:poly(3-hydroxybutyrate) depolymerase